MIRLDDYAYDLPGKAIATQPASPRDSARLLVYDTSSDTVAIDTFLHLDRHLPERSLLVMNDTKVVPARLWLTKESGGKIQVLLMVNELRPGDDLVKGIVDRRIDAGATLSFRSGATLRVARQEEQFFFFAPSFPMKELVAHLLAEGVTPIPPYIKGAPLAERALRERYQSVLAKHPASVAAPTASLHFTPRLLAKLEDGGIDRATITLHVGAGTFAPIDERSLREKRLFTEYYEVTRSSAKAIARAKAHGRPIVPVGTTSMRTLESIARDHPGVPFPPAAGPTDIFIFPPYRFAVADALVTNFHVPRSSLMLLVDAFLDHKNAKRRILDLYDIAMKRGFRFYSFGDGMLIK